VALRRDHVRGLAGPGVVHAGFLQLRALRILAIVDPLVARLLLEPVDEAEHAPREVVVDRRALARAPAESDDGERGAAPVQAVLPVARRDPGLALGRAPVLVLQPAAVGAGDELLHQGLDGLDDLPLIALAFDDAFEAVDEAIQSR